MKHMRLLLILALLASLAALAAATGHLTVAIEDRAPQARLNLGEFSMVLNGKATRASWGEHLLFAPFITTDDHD